MQEFTGENDELIPDGEVLEQLADGELQMLLCSCVLDHFFVLNYSLKKFYYIR
ncbi:hypothetical protein C240_2375 [Enterococcus sp. 5H]|nr:hypothetical protein [Enterococcus sp. 5H]